MHIRISLRTKFRLKLTILIFWTKLSKRVIPVKNGKSGHDQWILDIRISLGTKFQLKLTILIFFDQIRPKRKFLVENGKIALVNACMLVTYYIKLFRTGAERHNDIIMALLLLAAEKTKRYICWELHEILTGKDLLPNFAANINDDYFSVLIMMVSRGIEVGKIHLTLDKP